MTIGAHSRQLAEFLASSGLEAAVSLQLRDDTRADITLWPYAADFDVLQRNKTVPGRLPGGEPIRHDRFQRTHLLLLPSTLDAYDRARGLVLDNPVLQSGGHRMQVTIEALSIADMAALFSASGVPFRIALAVAIQ